MPIRASLKLSTVTGASTRKGREGEIEVLAAHHEVTSAVDEATGMPKGERTHGLFTIAKEIDLASVELRKAHAEGRVFEEWALRYHHQPMFGPIGPYLTTTLVKAKIAGIRLVMPPTFDTETGSAHEYEEVSWTYDSIAWGTAPPPKDADESMSYNPFTSTDTVLRFEPAWIEEEAKKALEEIAEAAKEKAKVEFEDELKAALEKLKGK